MQNVFPYNYFKDFIAPEVDRFRFLSSLLEDLHFGFSAILLGNLRHFFVLPHRGQGFLPGEIPSVVLVAHYDRVEGSPGANDNSAAVFMLLEAALKMREKKIRNWLIIFTDKEELSPGEGIREQGSYTLARGLRKTVLRKSRFYIFDACGSGDTLLISTMADHLIKNETGQGAIRTRQMVKLLRDGALKTARKLMMKRVLLVPTPFSDDAGFLRAGLAAQTITVLPSEEASGLASLLRNNPQFINALISREAKRTHGEFRIPKTWRCLNGPADDVHRLTPKNYNQVVQFVCELCRN
jgi:hypothetical protein